MFTSRKTWLSLKTSELQNFDFRKEMNNCFNHILIAVNICDRYMFRGFIVYHVSTWPDTEFRGFIQKCLLSFTLLSFKRKSWSSCTVGKIKPNSLLNCLIKINFYLILNSFQHHGYLLALFTNCILLTKIKLFVDDI